MSLNPDTVVETWQRLATGAASPDAAALGQSDEHHVQLGVVVAPTLIARGRWP